MRILFNILGAALILTAAACKKEGPQLTLNTGNAFSSALKTSADSVTLAPANDNDSVLTLSWPAVSYGNSVAATYTLELDTKSDTTGATPWGNAKKFVAGNNVLQYSFAGKDLNNLLQSLNLFSSTTLVFRVLSDVDQYNGSASHIPTVYSSVTSVKVTPYLTNLFVPGGYQGWNPAAAPMLNPVPGMAGVFEGYVNIAGSGLQYFKYTNAPDWSHTNYGDGGNNTFSTDGNAAGLSVPNGGYYELSANLNTNTWTATKTTWGIIGDATPGGWSSDTQMSYDATNQVWTVTASMIQAGSFKFRANNAWSIDFGIDKSGNIQYADNPLFPYNPNLNNLTVPADGVYLITLDLHVSGKYTYSAVKQ
ncbi:MAG TPA: SusE domain-containing protein [Puia sp.]|nr:SusE domain-containing protein [Puia sp.]